jgi:hypothetical protein
MSRARNITRAAGIGWVAAIASLAGAGAASADELADLRASLAALHDNQEVLQSRVDQLAQAGGPNVGGQGALGSPTAPGAVSTGGSFPRSFLIPGTQTSIRVGGFIDETIDYYLQNGPANGNPSTTLGINGNLTAQPLDIHG